MLVLAWNSERGLLRRMMKKLADNEDASEPDQDADTTASESELAEGLDYYLENGLLVFTARFLLKRGYCCDSGCRHCPYDKNSIN